MVYKRITTKKTHTGYTTTVFYQDGRICKPLYFGLEKFFYEWEKQENGQEDLKVQMKSGEVVI
jgi:hypothetical protein